MKSMLVGIRSLLPGVLIALGPSTAALAADLHVPGQYATIQAAVDAASSGDTIRIAAGDYYEQVLITNKSNLTLAGEPGEPASVLHAFAGMIPTFADLVTVSADVIPLLGTLRSEVLVTNLTFDGAGLADSYPGVLRGIVFFAAGGRVENCTVKEFRGASDTGARGISAFNPVSFGTPIVNVSVLNSTFADNARAMVLNGDPLDNPALLRTRFTVEGNTLVGRGPTASTAHFGLLIFVGAGGEVRRNTMTDFSQNSLALFSAAIVHQDGQFTTRGFLPVQPVRYEGNTFSNNDDHLVLMAANQSAVVNNIFHGTGGSAASGPRWGGLAVSGTNIVVANNDFSGMPTGIVLFGNNYFRGGQLVAAASNVSLNHNWFCDVTTPMNIRSGALGISDYGTQMCPFQPVLQSIASDGLSATLAVRAWHGQPMVIEASTDLQNWSPIYTNAMAMPRLEYRHDPLSTWLWWNWPVYQGKGPFCETGDDGVYWEPLQTMADPRRFYRAVQY